MARRVLSGPLGASLLLVLSLWSCRRHEQRAPAPSPSASVLGKDFTARARERHFQEELERAKARWQSKPGLGDCAAALKEKPDWELCQAASGALLAIAADPPATPERALSRLAPGALALARLSDRVRYLSLAELAQPHLEGAAGVAPAPSASGALARPLAALAAGRKAANAKPLEPRAIGLQDGSISQLLGLSIRLEREVIRNLGAYLEYGPLAVRRTAFDTIKRLRAEHPEWPLLDHLLREAIVLELDADLRRALEELSPSGSPRDGGSGQSAGTR